MMQTAGRLETVYRGDALRALAAMIWLGVAISAAVAQETPARSRPPEAPEPGASPAPATSPTPSVGSPATARPAEPKYVVPKELGEKVEELLGRRDLASALKSIDQALEKDSGNAALIRLRAEANCRFNQLDSCCIPKSAAPRSSRRRS
jgi:hypothetical protein